MKFLTCIVCMQSRLCLWGNKINFQFARVLYVCLVWVGSAIVNKRILRAHAHIHICRMIRYCNNMWNSEWQANRQMKWLLLYLYAQRLNMYWQTLNTRIHANCTRMNSMRDSCRNKQNRQRERKRENTLQNKWNRLRNLCLFRVFNENGTYFFRKLFARWIQICHHNILLLFEDFCSEYRPEFIRHYFQYFIRIINSLLGILLIFLKKMQRIFKSYGKDCWKNLFR